MMIDLGYAEFLNTYELTVSFTLNGVGYLGAISDRTDTRDLGIGGFELQTDQTLVSPVAQFNGTLPEEKQTVVVDGKTMRIESVRLSPDGKFIVLNLNDNTRGA